jgi:hypothetical protein
MWKIKKSNKKIYIFLLVFPLFILAAFRAPSVGNDTLNYYKSYLTVSQEAFFSPTQSRMEIGYIYYMRIIALLGFGYLGFQIITSAILLFSISRFIYKYSTNIAFSFFIFMTTRMFFGIMNISRQYLAIAVLLFSIECIRNKKLFKFSLFVLIAASIHFTAIFFFTAYFIANSKLNEKRSILLIMTGIFCGLLFDRIVLIFVSVTGRYSGYLEGRYFNFEGNIAIYINLLINLIFFSVAFFTKYWISREHTKPIDQISTSNKANIRLPYETIWYTLCLLTLIVSIVGLNATILSRIGMYFSVFFLVFIPSVIRSIKSKEIRTIISLGIVVGLFASFVVVMVYRPHWNTVFPYQWYWNW